MKALKSEQARQYLAERKNKENTMSDLALTVRQLRRRVSELDAAAKVHDDYIAELQQRIAELEAQLAAPVAAQEPCNPAITAPSGCNEWLREQGAYAIPRTCRKCGLGPCPNRA
jgi:hypothetical protein